MNQHMNTQERKHRLALTLLFTLLVLCMFTITVIISGFIVYILGSTGLIAIDRETLPMVLRILMLTTIISILIGMIITLAFSRISLRPLNKLINGMNQLACGDFKTRLHFGYPITRHPTFVELSDSFNTMAEELEQTEVLRKDFINNFSHEFKTPIVSIAGFAKLLKRQNIPETQKIEYLDAIEEESVRLSQMATNVLNLTRVENQTILTDTSTYNLSEQLRSAILLLENKWSKKQLELEADFNEYSITANEELLKQVWINLIDNAIKFSPDYGMLRFEIQEDPQWLQVSITNTGETIPPEQQGKIFRKFYQADESHSSEGNGIGLAIVHRIVELHHGEIQVDSRDAHTTFTVKLPNQ